jgi:hypothetical protein
MTIQHTYIEEMLIRDDIPYDLITCEKVPAKWYLDDRAVTVTSWDKIVSFIKSEIPQEELAYAAGFFDGEGSIGVYSYRKDQTNNGGGKYGSMSISISQRKRETLDWLVDRFGGSVYLNGTHKPNPIYQWRLNAKQGADFLRAILPWLRDKRDQAELALKFAETVRVNPVDGIHSPLTNEEKEARLEIIEELKRMKRA